MRQRGTSWFNLRAIYIPLEKTASLPTLQLRMATSGI